MRRRINSTPARWLRWSTAWFRRLGGTAWLLALIACSAPQVTQGVINVSVSVDGRTANLEVAAGSTVQQTLEQAGIDLEPLDRTEPPDYTVLTDGDAVRVIRVTEEFSIEEIVLPFDRQIVKNEALPEGESRLVQPGVNGLQEITYRRVYEDGVEVSLSPVKSVILQEPVPEIVMIGSQTPFTAVPIPGRLAYLSAGNAWVMEITSGNRRPVVATGDLDGQVFRLSPDGEWLLFSRRSTQENVINTLWAAKITGNDELLIDLQTENIIHFADWVPGSSVLRVVYSTVEPRSTAPGWQANNDLGAVSFSTSGWVGDREILMDANSGGIYGWWGTSFVWSPDGSRLAYARPDGVGLLDLPEDEEEIRTTPVLSVVPLQTQSDWAWVPGLSWAPTGDALYTVDHSAAETVAALEESPNFDLAAVSLVGGRPLSLIPLSGMFAYPAASPAQTLTSGEQYFLVAYLQAIFPTQSEDSRYRLMVMDRDASNRHVLFPPDGAPGMDPRPVLWAPESNGEIGQYWIALIYQGNIWLVDSLTGESHQLSGDGLIDRLDWR